MLCNNMGKLNKFATGLLLKHYKKSGFFSGVAVYGFLSDAHEFVEMCFLTKIISEKQMQNNKFMHQNITIKYREENLQVNFFACVLLKRHVQIDLTL